MRKISLLPSLLTICNFSCGFISAILCIQSIYWRGVGEMLKSNSLFDSACYIIFLGMIFDMFDGRVARMTNSQSAFGGELDSLADVVTFGVAPSIILGTLWIRVMPDTAEWWSFALIAGVIYAACGALRLAMYNLTISGAPKDYFSGLPSPAAAGAVVSAVLFLNQDYTIDIWNSIYSGVISEVVTTTKSAPVVAMYAFSVYVMLIGLMMVSPFRFAHAANIWFGKDKKFYTLVAVLMIIAALILYTKVMLFVGFNAFIILCVFFNIRGRIKNNKESEIDKEMEEAIGFEGE